MPNFNRSQFHSSHLDRKYAQQTHASSCARTNLSAHMVLQSFLIYDVLPQSVVVLFHHPLFLLFHRCFLQAYSKNLPLLVPYNHRNIYSHMYVCRIADLSWVSTTLWLPVSFSVNFSVLYFSTQKRQCMREFVDPSVRSSRFISVES